MDPASILNRANQLNPSHWAYWSSRGYDAASAITAASTAGINATAAGAGAIGAVAAGAGVVGAVAGTAVIASAVATVSPAISTAYTAYAVYNLGTSAYNWYLDRNKPRVNPHQALENCLVFGFE